MKLTKVTELPQSGEGTMHEVPRLRTKVGGPDKGADKPRPLEDIYSLGIKGRAHSLCSKGLSTMASKALQPVWQGSSKHPCIECQRGRRQRR